jgi:hypothetical protein
MKAKIILLNWGLSLCLVACLDTERSPMWSVLLMFAWFSGSSLLLAYADRRGWMDKIKKTLKQQTTIMNKQYVTGREETEEEISLSSKGLHICENPHNNFKPDADV